uniref:Uncharacterized protein n=1 Tax=Nelumbo nucifera TaxID=4432 RepID=A0A822Z220_NELNU|nr:TPA_asm: hypothetical protein HUJ06_007687 [Nelumbo nucifera]
MESEIAQAAQSSNTKTFPAELRVLIVDDDAICLKVVEAILRILKYQVVAVKNGLDALSILQERKGGFDLVLTDVYMPGMDGITLLKHIMAEFKLPVIIMSADDKENVILKCLKAGASYYIKKPITMNDVRNLWQHVVLKRKETIMEPERTRSIEGESDQSVFREDIECVSSVNEGNWKKGTKRNTTSSNDNKVVEVGKSVSFTTKRSRVVWTTELHQQFLDAVKKLGYEKAMPKKILEQMGISGLTRENIASHLQKYRIFLKRLKQASQAPEPSVARSLISKSSFAVGHPSLVLHLQGRLPELQDTQQFTGMSFRPRHGSSPMSQLHEHSISASNQGNLKKSNFLESSLDQRNGTKHSGFEVRSHIVTTSSLLGDTSNSHRSGEDIVQMNHQQPQMQSRPFASSSLVNRNMGSSNNHNQVPYFNYTNYNHAGIQIASAGEPVGFGKTVLFANRPSKSMSGSYNSMNEMQKGKGIVTATGKYPPFLEFGSFRSGFSPQGLDSSCGSQCANHFQMMFPCVIQKQQPSIQSFLNVSNQQQQQSLVPSFPNVIQKQQLPLPLQPLPEQKRPNLTEFESELDSLLDLVTSSPDIENTSAMQPFDEINDLCAILNQVDQDDQACGEVLMDPDFNINEYQMDDL